MPLQIDDKTDMNFMVPVSACDGTLISISPEAGLVRLMFYQVRKATGEHLDKIDVTGAVMMNVQDLENYRDAINENLDNIKNKEK